MLVYNEEKLYRSKISLYVIWCGGKKLCRIEMEAHFSFVNIRFGWGVGEEFQLNLNVVI